VGLHFDMLAISAVVPIWIQEIINSYESDSVAIALFAGISYSVS
jgi:hypothetical protein